MSVSEVLKWAIIAAILGGGSLVGNVFGHNGQDSWTKDKALIEYKIEEINNKLDKIWNKMNE